MNENSNRSTTISTEVAPQRASAAEIKALYTSGEYAAVLDITAGAQSWDVQFLRAKAMRKLGLNNEALVAARDAHSARPNHRDAFLHLVRLRRDLGHYAAALRDILVAADVFPKDRVIDRLRVDIFARWKESLKQRCEVGVEKAASDEITDHLVATMVEDSRFSEGQQQALRRIADGYSNDKAHNRVIALLEPLRDKLDADNMTILAASLRIEKRFEDARSIAFLALSKDPANQRAPRILRDVALNEKDYSAAYQINSAIVSLYPNFDNLLHQVRILMAIANNAFGTGYYMQSIPAHDAYTSAVLILKKLSVEHPKDSRVWELLGQFYGLVGNVEKAEECLNLAFNLKPSDKIALRLARIYFKRRRFDDARKACSLALECKNDNPSALYFKKFLDSNSFETTSVNDDILRSIVVIVPHGTNIEDKAYSQLKEDVDVGVTIERLYSSDVDGDAPTFAEQIADLCAGAPNQWYLIPYGASSILRDIIDFSGLVRPQLGAVWTSSTPGFGDRQVFVRGDLLREIAGAELGNASFEEIGRAIQKVAEQRIWSNLLPTGTRPKGTVAIVSRHGWLGFGGAEQFMRNIAQAYREHGYNVLIVGVSEVAAGESGSDDGINWCFVANGKDLRRLVLNSDISVLHATGIVYEAAAAAQGLDVKIVYGFHFFREILDSPHMDQGYYPNEPETLPVLAEAGQLVADLSIMYANSIYSRRLVEDKLNIRLPVIYSTSYHRPEELVGDRTYALLMNARQDKGFRLLLDVAAQLPHRQFVAVASQSSYLVAARWVQARGLANVTVLDRTDDIDDLYAGARIVLAPSFEFVETFSRVTIEAQARGRVVIGANAGNIPFLLESSGVLLEENADKWAAVIEEMFSDDVAYEAACSRALENAEKFSPDVFRHQAGAVIKSLGMRILVGVGGGVGNTIHATPLIRKISEHFGVRVDVVLSEGGTSYFDVVDNALYVSSIHELGERILQKPFDLVVLTNCFGDITPQFNAKRQLNARDYDVFKPGVSTHETIFNMEFGKRLLGIDWTADDAEQYFIGDMVYRKPESGIIAIHAGSKGGRWEAKRWPHYSHLSMELMKRGYRVVSVGIPEEHVPGTEDWTGGTIGEMANRLLGVDYVISNDSGVMNIANALGVPLTAVFAPTDVGTRGPLRRSSRAVSVEKDCSPCEVKSPSTFTQGLCACIAELRVDEVLADVLAGLDAEPSLIELGTAA